MNKAEYKARKDLLKDKCPICKKRFKLGDKFILCAIQEPAGDFYINAIAIPIHAKCYYVEKNGTN